jgi:gluconolactonase
MNGMSSSKRSRMLANNGIRVAGVCLLAALMMGAADPSGDPAVIVPGATVETLFTTGEFTEGVAVASSGLVFFSDIAIASDNPGRLLMFDPATRTTSVFVKDSGQSNGLFFTADGRLLAACGAKKGLQALCEVTTSGTMKVLVNQYQGKTFNAPNDLVVHPRGWVYFSDPRYVGSEPLQLDHQSVFRYDPDGSVHRVTDKSISKPNGLILSPDGKMLYVAETDNGSTGVEPAGTPPGPARFTLNALPVHNDGSLGPKKVLKDLGQESGIDGMSMDTAGRIYAAVRIPTRFGIAVYSPEGTEVAFIPTETPPTNCTFGVGAEAHVLYITAGTGLYRIKLASTGARLR